MIFIYNASGGLINVYPDHVYQGSDGATKIYFMAPFSAGSVVQVAYTKPNGERTSKIALSAFSGDLSSVVQTTDGDGYNIWVTSLTGGLTTYSGTLTAQFFVSVVGSDAQDNEITVNTLSTESAQITVEKGVRPIPIPDNPDSYDSLAEALAAFSTAYENDINDLQADVSVLQSVIHVIDSEYIRIYNLSAGIYKLTYQGIKYIQYNGAASLLNFQLDGAAPVMLYVTEYTNRKFFLIWQANTSSDLLTVFHGYATYQTGTYTRSTMLGSADIAYTLTHSAADNKVLAANQGYALKRLIDQINALIPSSASSTNKLVDAAQMQAFAMPITTKYGANLSLVFNSVNGQLTVQLKDQDGNNLGQAQTVTIDLTSLENTINNILALIPPEASPSNQLMDRDSVVAFVNSLISTVYTIQGTSTVNTLNGLTKTEQRNGYVYDVSDGGTLTNEDGSTVSVSAGDNVVFIWNYGAWKWDKLASNIDLSNYWTITDVINFVDGYVPKQSSAGVLYSNNNGDVSTRVLANASTDETPNANSVVQRDGTGGVRCTFTLGTSDYQAVNAKGLKLYATQYEYERDIPVNQATVSLFDRKVGGLYESNIDYLKTELSFYITDTNGAGALVSHDITRLIQSIQPTNPGYGFVSGSAYMYDAGSAGANSYFINYVMSLHLSIDSDGTSAEVWYNGTHVIDMTNNNVNVTVSGIKARTILVPHIEVK